MDYTIHYKADKIEQLLDKMNTLHIPEAVPVYTRDSAVADIDAALERFRTTVVVPETNSIVANYINALDSYDEPVTGQYVSAVSEADGKIVVSRESLPAMPTIPTKVSAFDNDKNYLTEHQSLEAYAKKTDLPVIPTKVSAFTNDKGYLTESSLSDYAKKSELPVVPTNVSAFINDAGYITTGDIPTKTSDLTNDSDFITHADLPTVPTKVSELTNDSDFATVPRLESKAVELQGNIDTVDSKVNFVSDAVSAVTTRVVNVEAGLLDKQDKLTAGANISIDGNKISASFIQSQSDWAQTDAAKPDFIQNKPDLNIAGWNTAAELAHSHVNIDVLDNLTAEDVDVWNATTSELVGLERDVIPAKQDKLVAGTGITIDPDTNVISATGTEVSWGNISGNLAEQSDLQSVLNSKQGTIIIREDSTDYLALGSDGRLGYTPHDTKFEDIAGSPLDNAYLKTYLTGDVVVTVDSVLSDGTASNIGCARDVQFNYSDGDTQNCLITLKALNQWAQKYKNRFALTAGTNVSIDTDRKINVNLEPINSEIASLKAAVNNRLIRIDPGENITVEPVSTGVVKVSAASVSPAWGAITGTLSSQSDLNAELNSIKSSKQDKLVAGSNIQIAADGKTISATDTKYNAGFGISIVGNTISQSNYHNHDNLTDLEKIDTVNADWLSVLSALIATKPQAGNVLLLLAEMISPDVAANINNYLHQHANKSVLDGIKSTDIANWNNKAKSTQIQGLNMRFVDSLPASPAANTLYFVKE